MARQRISTAKKEGPYLKVYDEEGNNFFSEFIGEKGQLLGFTSLTVTYKKEHEYSTLMSTLEPGYGICDTKQV